MPRTFDDTYLKKVWKIDCSFCLAAFIKVPSVKKPSIYAGLRGLIPSSCIPYAFRNLMPISTVSSERLLIPSVKKASDDAFSLKIFQERVRSQMR